MTDRKVWVENISRATVTIMVPNCNFVRELRGEGSKTQIPFDIMFEGLSEPGVNVMFDEGFLYIPNKQDRIDLGLETEEDEVKVEDKVMSSAKILEILKSDNAPAIKEMLDNLAIEQKKKVAEVAIDNKITSYGVATLIKQATGIDVIKRVQQDAEAENEN